MECRAASFVAGVEQLGEVIGSPGVPGSSGPYFGSKPVLTFIIS